MSEEERSLPTDGTPRPERTPSEGEPPEHPCSLEDELDGWGPIVPRHPQEHSLDIRRICGRLHPNGVGCRVPLSYGRVREPGLTRRSGSRPSTR